MKNIIIFFCFMIFFSFDGGIILKANDDSPVRTNYEIIDSLLDNYSNEMIKSQSLSKGEKIKFDLTQHPAKWLLYDKLLNLFINDSCIIYNDSNENINRFYEININNISIKYLNSSIFPDSVEREIYIQITGSRIIKNIIVPLRKFNAVFKDKISRDKVDSINSSQYDFASSAMPVQDKTFFDNIIQPVILISSTIVAVVLLFTVRSN
ncbi:MAG: hypothetical protein HZB41_04305 [Ignavibacteriae bacterium]|nr:hypothetical protein [Ignavibacteriota bacterium]